MKLHELALSPAALLYGRLVAAKRALYRRGVLEARRAPLPVLCVGNLSLGGTGKTPMVEYVSRLLMQQGLRVAIVSRGYRRETPARQLVVVSDGRQILASAREGGDEPQLLARTLPGVAVVVCSSRYRGALYLAERKMCDVVVLDDGFQHWQLARQGDIVLVDATVELSRMRLFPAGTLREPPSALGRARAVVHTKVDAALSHYEANRAEVSRLAPEVAQFAARFVLDTLSAAGPGQGEPPTLEQLRGARVMAFAGVAHPELFFEQLRALGLEVVGRPYPDHAAYSVAQLRAIGQEAKDQGCPMVLTTAKDAVKLCASELDGSLGWWVLTQRVELDRPGEFLALLRASIAEAAEPPRPGS
jgi:tetraacyldisaccharide 4'-kinase